MLKFGLCHFWNGGVMALKDIEFVGNHVTVRDGTGRKDRIIMLPKQVKPQLIKHFRRIWTVQELWGKGGFKHNDLYSCFK